MAVFIIMVCVPGDLDVAFSGLFSQEIQDSNVPEALYCALVITPTSFIFFLAEKVGFVRADKSSHSADATLAC